MQFASNLHTTKQQYLEVMVWSKIVPWACIHPIISNLCTLYNRQIQWSQTFLIRKVPLKTPHSTNLVVFNPCLYNQRNFVPPFCIQLQRKRSNEFEGQGYLLQKCLYCRGDHLSTCWRLLVEQAQGEGDKEVRRAAI